MQLLHIPQPKKPFILWEHLLKSTVAFIGTFALLFFGPMMLGRRRGREPEDSLAYKLMTYILDHPEVHAGISVLAVVLLNVYLLYKNRRIRYVVGIELDADTIRLQKTNLYYSATQQVVVPAADFAFHIEQSTSEDDEKRQKLVFRSARENTVIGEIDPAHFFWAEHVPQLRAAIRELKAYRTESVSKKSGWLGISSVFRR